MICLRMERECIQVVLVVLYHGQAFRFVLLPIWS